MKEFTLGSVVGLGVCIVIELVISSKSMLL